MKTSWVLVAFQQDKLMEILQKYYCCWVTEVEEESLAEFDSISVAEFRELERRLNKYIYLQKYLDD